MADTEHDITVTHDVDRNRFRVSVDGQPAGFALYRDRGGRRLFVHTEVDEDFGGMGVGSALVRGALDHTRDEGMQIVPVCPFVESWIDKHPDYADLVDVELFNQIG